MLTRSDLKEILKTRYIKTLKDDVPVSASTLFRVRHELGDCDVSMKTRLALQQYFKAEAEGILALIKEREEIL